MDAETEKRGSRARKITKRLIDSLKPDPNNKIWIADTEMRGFYLVIHPTGVRSFVIRYTTPAGRRNLTIGIYGHKTVEQARKDARIKMAGAEDGQDPALERAEDKAALTFGEWRKTYLGDIELRKKSWKKDKAYLVIAGEAWDNRLLRDLTADDVNRLFTKMQEQGKKTRANRWLAAIRTCLAAAWRLNKIQDNPAMRVRLLPENPPRQRVLSDDELTALVDAIAELEDPHLRLAFTLLLETGARLSEVLRATWEDVDLEGASWRLPSSKSGRPQTIPLAPSTVAILKKTLALGPYLVPGRDPKMPRFDLKRPWDDLCKAASLEGVHIHDVRRTYGLHAARQAGLHIASKLLRHSTVAVTERVYVPLGLDDLRKGTAKVSRERGKVIKMVRKKRKEEAG